MSRDQYEPSTTIQFTFTSSVAPDSAPVLVITGVDNTAISSLSAVSSDSTHFYTLFTTPASDGVYMGQWTALKTFVGSSYQFKKSFLFNVGTPKRVF